MQITYTVVKGQQYDPEGARVTFGPLVARYRRDGGYDCGDMPAVAHSDAVSAAVLRVVSTGKDETVICGESDRTTEDVPAQGCPDCGTYCYGDCRS